ncbi:MAG: TIGR04283 family arsenosugar biosynthesis glycosyltransferase [Candidatus Thermoplasmatota archaeon]|nr:TIGR04283 family arsenosugar biosynthesis glycosyltransferase [Candidatus Thermoplasmatota archaeon]
MRFSVIVPVLHERDIVNRTIEDIRSVENGSEVELIVVDGAPERDTLSAIRRKGVLRIASERGRARQMNAGANIATGDVLIFLHTDTSLPSNALSEIEEKLREEDVVGGAFDIALVPSNLYLRAIDVINIARVRITRVPYGDHAIFMKREVFEAIGGYKEVPIMEDVEMMRRLRRNKMRIRILKGPARTSSRRFADDGYIRHSLRYFLLHLKYWTDGDLERMSDDYYSH